MEFLYNYLFLKISLSIFVVLISKSFTKNAETKVNKEQPNKQYLIVVPNLEYLIVVGGEWGCDSRSKSITISVGSFLGQTNPYKNLSYEVKWIVIFVRTWNLTFPYNYVREIKLIRNFKTIRTFDITEARHQFYTSSICIHIYSLQIYKRSPPENSQGKLSMKPIFTKKYNKP